MAWNILLHYPFCKIPLSSLFLNTQQYRCDSLQLLFGMTIDKYMKTTKEDVFMSYKIVTTALLVIIASTLLVILAFKVRTGATADMPRNGQVVSKGCCGSSGGGCAANK